MMVQKFIIEGVDSFINSSSYRVRRHLGSLTLSVTLLLSMIGCEADKEESLSMTSGAEVEMMEDRTIRRAESGGDDAEGEAGMEEIEEMEPVEGCPPEGPFGATESLTTPDVTLYRCDGTPIGMHQLCPRRAAYVYTYADWCPNCRNFADDGQANELYRRYKEHDFDMWFVITAQSDSSTPPSAEYCQMIKERYGLEMTVLYDPDGVTNSALDMRVNTADMVLTRGNKIVTNGPWAFFVVEDALQRIYGF